MFSAPLRNVPKSALIRHIANYLEGSGLFPVPAWYNPEDLSSDVAWYREGALTIVQLMQVPMIRPKMTLMSLHGKAFAHFLNQYELMNWIRTDPTGILLVTNLCIESMGCPKQETTKL
jgi:hypothetical protein